MSFRIEKNVNPAIDTANNNLGTYLLNVHSKNTGVKLDPERVHWVQTPFRVNDYSEISQPDAEYDQELGQSDPIICQFCK